jgi:hypothetical protein
LDLAALNRAAAAAYQASFSKLTKLRLGLILLAFFRFALVGITFSLCPASLNPVAGIQNPRHCIAATRFRSEQNA